MASTSSTTTAASDSPFPWSLGVYDAHCHPTTIMASTKKLGEMKTTALVALATRSRDQELVEDIAREKPLKADDDDDDGGGGGVNERQDGCRVVGGFGYHPWYSHWLINDMDENGCVREENSSALPGREAHYMAILQPKPRPLESAEDREFMDDLPEPIPLSSALDDMRRRLAAHPNALIGEIGVDTSARLVAPYSERNPGRIADSCDCDCDCARLEDARNGRRLSRFRVSQAHQKTVLAAQLKLAGEMNRAVSIHSVGAHGAVLDVLRELWKGHERKSKRKMKQAVAEEKYIQVPGYFQDEYTDDDDHDDEPSRPRPFPPRICMHSYTGPPEQLARFLYYSVPAEVYFSFSVAVNYLHDTKEPPKVSSIIQAIPDDRILIETDMNRAGQDLDRSLEEVARKVCREKKWELEDGVRILGENWRRLVFG